MPLLTETGLEFLKTPWEAGKLTARQIVEVLCGWSGLGRLAVAASAFVVLSLLPRVSGSQPVENLDTRQAKQSAPAANEPAATSTKTAIDGRTEPTAFEEFSTPISTPIPFVSKYAWCSAFSPGGSWLVTGYGHWNEEGNKIAAAYLFKYLAEDSAIDYEGDGFIEKNFYRYYQSFYPASVSESWLQEAEMSDVLVESIRSRYLALTPVYFPETTALK